PARPSSASAGRRSGTWARGEEGTRVGGPAPGGLLPDRVVRRRDHRAALGEDAVDDGEEVLARRERLDALAEPARAGEAAQVEARELAHLERRAVLAAQRRRLG